MKLAPDSFGFVSLWPRKLSVLDNIAFIFVWDVVVAGSHF